MSVCHRVTTRQSRGRWVDRLPGDQSRAGWKSGGSRRDETKAKGQRAVISLEVRKAEIKQEQRESVAGRKVIRHLLIPFALTCQHRVPRNRIQNLWQG